MRVITLLLFGALSVLFIPVCAQWLNGSPSGAIYYNSGNVGINTSTSPVNNKLQIGPNGPGWNNNDFVVGNANGSLAIHSLAGGETYIYGSQSISIKPGFGQYGIFAKSNGDVGIGTNAPLVKLHVEGSVRGSGATNGALRISTPTGYVDVGSQNATWAHFQTDRGKFYFNRPIEVDGTISSYSTSNLVLRSGGVDRLSVLSSNGYTGINIVPAARLHILQSGGGWADGLRITNNSKSWDFVSDSNGDRLLIARDQNTSQGLSILNGNLGIGVASPAYKVEVASGSQAIRLLTGSNTSAYSLDVGVNDNGVNFSNNSAIRGYNFQNTNGNLMNIQSNGNVGIGTTAPDAKLAVNGQVHATEVRVTTTVPGPDYVFDKDYNLPSIEDLQRYIAQNKHLPEVPSAKEMEADGIRLGEMNMLLLKKVEELTLYIIELKESDKQRALELEAMKSKLKP